MGRRPLSKGFTRASSLKADTVFQTVVLTNGDRVVVFRDQTDNYRVPPTPDTVLHALAEARASKS
jgi:hypothetical protein